MRVTRSRSVRVITGSWFCPVVVGASVPVLLLLEMVMMACFGGCRFGAFFLATGVTGKADNGKVVVCPGDHQSVVLPCSLVAGYLVEGSQGGVAAGEDASVSIGGQQGVVGWLSAVRPPSVRRVGRSYRGMSPTIGITGSPAGHQGHGILLLLVSWPWLW